MSATRRAILAALLAAPFGAPAGLRAEGAALALTPDCDDGDEAPTPAQTEGPYFRTDSPLKQDFRADVAGGTAITLAGFALDRNCRPIEGALVELWHADPEGAYDNRGYRLRGHQFTDAAGLWSFATVVPGVYPGRTRHYHLKAQPRGGRVLTTQLYFPGEPRNDRDRIFDPRLLLGLGEAGGASLGRFDLVLA